MFKWLLENSLANRLLVIIASVVLMTYGAFTLTKTPVDVFPDLNKPTVTIMIVARACGFPRSPSDRPTSSAAA